MVMPNIKPVSDLRNYAEVLRDISVGEPVFLTKNGRGRYVIIDIEDYEKTNATIKLLKELSNDDRHRPSRSYACPVDKVVAERPNDSSRL
jgi:antitoxin Phd